LSRKERPWILCVTVVRI